MDIVAQIREAFINLFPSKLRSFLAILGILVGTGSVVALISSSQLATAHALEQFKSLGTNLLGMFIEDDPSVPKVEDSQRLSLNDVAELKKATPLILEAAPYVTVYQGMSFKGQQFNGQIIGVTNVFSDIAKVRVNRGRFISFLDKNDYFCVIGAKVAAQMQNLGVNPLYQQIRVGDNFFTVIGIAKSWQPDFFLFVDIDSGILIPIETSFLIGQNTQIENILFRVAENAPLTQIQNQLSEKLKTLLPQKKADFRNPAQIIDIVGKQRQTFTWLLASIGSISLVVGGIGVMNIMLVSVIERRREIGVRMAIGAKKLDILKMFLIESIILTLFGGIIGIILGILISFILSITSKWAFHLYLLPPFLGFTVSVLVGVLSGFYPSFRAASVDPIESLQSE